MWFKPKYFLDLSGGDEAQTKPAEIAPVKQPEPASAKPAAAAKTAAPAVKAVPAQAVAAPAAPATPAATNAAATGGNLTTAEAIAAELAAVQANRPAPSQATFAPDCLSAGAAVPRRRRLAGANLGTFKDMARGMMKS
ncbi:MAG: hypothetical protein ACKO6F_03310 [Cyanobium sp.]